MYHSRIYVRKTECFRVHKIDKFLKSDWNFPFILYIFFMNFIIIIIVIVVTIMIINNQFLLLNGV